MPRSSSNTALIVFAWFGGAVLGVVTSVVLAAAAPALIGALMRSPQSGKSAFSPSVAIYVYYLGLSLGAAAGTYGAFRSRFPAVLRAALIGFAVAMLGMFALCDAVSAPLLFQR